MNPPRANKIIGIVGGSGAGKTWLVQRLCRLLGEHACHLSLDDFYLDRSHLTPARRARLNFDVPRAIDWTQAAQALRDCRAGLPARVPRYDFATHSRRAEPQVWHPRPIVLVEGLWLLRPAELRSLFDLKIYLDTPADLRRDRRVTRDTLERGYTAEAVRQRLDATVRPMHARYVEPQRRHADLVIAQPYRVEQVEALGERLWSLLSAAGAAPCWMRETFRAELLSLLVEHEYCN